MLVNLACKKVGATAKLAEAYEGRPDRWGIPDNDMAEENWKWTALPGEVIDFSNFYVKEHWDF